MNPRTLLRRTAIALVVLIALMLANLAAHATTIVVPDDVPTLQAAIDSIRGSETPPDSVLVHAGTVTDSLNTVNVVALTIVGLGDSTTSPVVQRLVGNANDHLTFVNLRFTGLITTVGLTHLIFENCRLEGGLFSQNDGSARSVRLRDCRVTNCLAGDSDLAFDVADCSFEGGSIDITGDGTILLRNCLFRNTGTAVHAQGEVSVHCDDSRFEGCTAGVVTEGEAGPMISGNRFDGCGTAISVSGDQFGADVENNVVLHGTGPGIVFSNAPGLVANNVVGWSHGVGFDVVISDPYYADELTLRNNTSFGNDGDGFHVRLMNTYYYFDTRTVLDHNIGCANRGYGLRCDGDRRPEAISCNDWFANDSGAVHGVDLSQDDLTVDPLFCDVATGDVHLHADSPLANAPGCGLIGALGIGCAATTAVLPSAPVAFALRSVRPNPTAGPARIAFALPREAAVDLDVYDVAGRHVASLAHGTLGAGEHEVAWSATPGGAGVYLVRYRYPGGSATGRLVQIR